ncbi:MULTISPECIES: hypothetical protein [unclassified Streptomyces]|uniref:alpha/beta fold hydrolase n=1 Tax=Streptomyces sp. NBC_00474 TaxID=2975754 RepID=UPI002B1E29C5|nr:MULTISPECIES: hypothetical protein [unclassified Streptomyces]
MDAELRTVRANDITLAYRAWDPAEAPRVLLLHCRCADGADWTPIAERLASGPRPRRAYAPDLEGPRAKRLAGHLVHQTRPEEFLAVVEGFLAH